LNDITWVLSCLSPWAVSPHPNFSETKVSPDRLLALVTERRFRREADRYSDGLDSEAAWDFRLVSAAEDSLWLHTQPTAVQRLVSLTEDRHLPAEARCAAALFAAVGLSELERQEEAIRLLSRLLDELGEDDSGSALSRQLVSSTLHAQIAMRLLDVGRRSEALAWSTRGIEILSTKTPHVDLGIELSMGISWKARRVVDDALTSVRAHLLGTRARSEELDGESWVDVVRQRRSWPDTRALGVAAHRDASFIAETYESRLGAHRGRITMGKGDVTFELGAEALLIAELSGDSNSVTGHREALGRYRLLRARDLDRFEASEALRLLRTARSKDSLEMGLDWVRARGPLSAVEDAANAILKRRTLRERLDEFELAILADAADLLKPRDLARAIAAIIAVHLSGQATLRSIEIEKAWRALARLLPESGRDSKVIAQVLRAVRHNVHSFPSTTSAMCQVVEAAEWGEVATGVRQGLVEWAQTVPTEADLHDLAMTVLRVAGVVPEGGISPVEATFRLLDDESTDTQADPSIVMFFIEQLGSIVQEARGSRIAFGGIDMPALATALALRWDDRKLWHAIESVLIDGNVDAYFKRLTLDSLARTNDRPPKYFVDALRSNWNTVSNPKRDRLFSPVRQDGVFVEAIRAAASLGLASRDELMRQTLKLTASSDPEAQLQGARTIAYVAAMYESPEWAHALLLQLSVHEDPNVGAAAARGLVATRRMGSALASTVEDRVIEILGADGLRRPLYALHEYQAALRRTQQRLSRREVDVISSISENHSSRILRGAAAEVLRLNRDS